MSANPNQPWLAGVPQQQPPQAPQNWGPPASPPQAAPQVWQPSAGVPGQWAPGAQPPPQAPAQQAPVAQYGAPPAQNWGVPAQEDFFSQLDNALPQGQQGEFFQEGDFHVRIEKTSIVTSRKSGKNLYTIESEVIASNNPNQPPGTRCTAMIDLSNRDMRDKNMMTFLAAAMGHDPGNFQPGQRPPNGQTWSTLARETLQPHQILRGLAMGLRAVNREKKNGAGEFTDLGWMPQSLLVIGPARVRQEAPAFAALPGGGHFGASPAQGGGVPPSYGGGGFGAPPVPGGGGGFGAPPAPGGGFGAPPAPGGGGFGAPPAPGGGGGFGAPPQAQQPPPNAWGVPPGPGFGR